MPCSLSISCGAFWALQRDMLCKVQCVGHMNYHAGALAVKRVEGVPTIFPAEGGHVSDEENLLQTVYDCGPVQVG